MRGFSGGGFKQSGAVMLLGRTGMETIGTRRFEKGGQETPLAVQPSLG